MGINDAADTLLTLSKMGLRWGSCAWYTDRPAKITLSAGVGNSVTLAVKHEEAE